VRILVSGPRGWTDWGSLLVALVRVSTEIDPREITLIEGEADGFDKLARNIALWLGWKVEPYAVTPDDWYPGGKYDPAAGHKRNQLMVDSGADIAIAGIMMCEKHPKRGPHVTHGTADCIRRIEKAEIPLREVYPQ
jgi:hypothetical protein